MATDSASPSPTGGADPPSAPPLAVLLAAGRGARLQRADPAVEGGLSEGQRRACERGLKSLLPLAPGGDRSRERPLVSFVLELLRDAGVERVCCVVRPELGSRPEHFPAPPGLRVELAVQEEPRGTGHALLAAESFLRSAGARDTAFLVLNADTLYPPSIVRSLVALDGPGLVALDACALAADARSNLGAERIAGWAEVSADEGGFLREVLPAPGDPPERRWWVNVNAWRFDGSILEACRTVEPAPSGEIELPPAVARSQRLSNLRYRVVQSDAPILDVTARVDIPAVERLLPALLDETPLSH